MWTCCWWRTVAWYQSQVSSVQMDSSAGWCTVAHREKHAWVVRQQVGHVTVWISSSKCWNYSNSVNIWCFAVYMTLYCRRWQDCHFLAHPVVICLAAPLVKTRARRVVLTNWHLTLHASNGVGCGRCSITTADERSLLDVTGYTLNKRHARIKRTFFAFSFIVSFLFIRYCAEWKVLKCVLQADGRVCTVI